MNVCRSTHSRRSESTTTYLLPSRLHDIVPHQRGECGLHRRRACETMAGADVRRQQFAALFDDDGAGGAARCAIVSRCQRASNIIRCSARSQLERLMEVVERRAAAGRAPHFVPRLVREPLHVVHGRLPGELDDGRAEPRLRSNA